MQSPGTTAIPERLDDVLDLFETQLRRIVANLPLHLMSEEEMRRALSDVLLGIDRTFYSQVRHLQHEKRGSGIPKGSSVDLYFELEGKPIFVELKHWHTMVKVRSGALEIGEGNNTAGDYRVLKRDFSKQASIDNAASTRLILYLVQVGQYPNSKSHLPIDHAREYDSANARALFDSTPGAPVRIQCEDRTVRFQIERVVAGMNSPEGIPSTLYAYRVIE